jgi:crotonobetainyl-CoA:carnitine CoA-transferase CaiB-like acyl-CoA transferase
MRPLAGIRVLELARVLAGPWAGQILADLGADVIKVERPGGGDDTRFWGPPFFPGINGGKPSAAYFHATNRGKRSIVADFDDAGDRELVLRLAHEADVVIENYKVGGLVKYGLDHQSLRAVNERLVYCSITGFGQNGPYAARPGYDFVIQGMAGVMDLTGDPFGEPQKVGVAFADIFTGVYAANAIVAALYDRVATGRGMHLDLALLDCQVSVLANQATNFLASGTPPVRLGNAHPNIVPYQTFRTADGEIVIASGTDGQFRQLCSAIGMEELAGDPRFTSNADRVRHREILIDLLSARIHTLHSAELLRSLDAVGVPSGPINKLDAVFADPQVLHRQMKVDLSRSDGSTVPGVRSPIVADGCASVSDVASPELGEHTEAVRAALLSGTSPWRA